MLSILKTNIKIVFSIWCIGLLLSNTGFAAQNKVLYKGIVNSLKLNIRSAPSRDSDVVIVIEKGDTVDVIKKQGSAGGWLPVEYKGNKGYIRNRSRYIKLIPVPPPKKEEKEDKTKYQGPDSNPGKNGRNILPKRS